MVLTTCLVRVGHPMTFVVFFAFQEKQASRKEQAPSSLVARNSSYDDVVSEDFLGLHE